MRIRPEQLNVLEQASLHAYERAVVEHALQFAPHICETAGEDHVRRGVHLGFKRAALYGFTCQGPLRFYVEMMLCCGSDFDTDPLLPWAAQALQELADAGEMERADHLHRSMQVYTASVLGPEDESLAEALERFLHARPGDIANARVPLRDRLLRAFELLYPEKTHYVGDAPLRILIDRAADTAAQLNLIGDQGHALIAGLMFAFGHGVLADPFVPWVQDILSDGRGQDRVDRVYARAREYAERLRGEITPVAAAGHLGSRR